MRFKNFLLIVFCLAVMFTVPAFCEDNETDEDNFFVSEEKFCETIKSAGIKEAFAIFGSNQTTIVQSSSIGFKEWFNGLEDGRKMEFYPSKMVVSSSGDFGFSVGSWKEGEGTLGMWGNYLNVWKKIGLQWKIIIHSKTVLPPQIAFQKSKTTEKIELSSERKPSQSASKKEEEFFSILKDYGWAKIYNEFADDDVIKIRSDAMLEKGKKGVFIKSVAERGYITGKPKKSISSKSRDLVMFLGSAKTGGPTITAQGSFIHIWKKDSEGNYKLFLDLFISERTTDRMRKKLL
ncbi:MAG: hypothetical protein GYA35_06030 [Thermoanaerobaculaceae bacterium]|nr:hypothetical protein [Thermoanaerobaculaceae bacterium]